MSLPLSGLPKAAALMAAESRPLAEEIWQLFLPRFLLFAMIPQKWT
ncbi:MAG: hypothetical protein K2J64_05790 [Desulfovibrio sp.]|nr:hypothetical protein [Desulfovibrio sp.]